MVKKRADHEVYYSHYYEMICKIKNEREREVFNNEKIANLSTNHLNS